jgi:hypothetical protein
MRIDVRPGDISPNVRAGLRKYPVPGPGKALIYRLNFQEAKIHKPYGLNGGVGGIRTLDTGLGYAHLANECLQPLGHDSVARLGI